MRARAIARSVPHRDEGGSLSSSRIIEVLEAVGCRGAVEERSNLITELRRLVHNNPAMCEQFFLVQKPSPEDEPAVGHVGAQRARQKPATAWSAAITVLEQTDTTDSAAAALIIPGILAILSSVAQQVGVGVENLRELLSMPIRSGRWAPYASATLDALHDMVLGDAAPPHLLAPEARAETLVPGGGAGARAGGAALQEAGGAQATGWGGGGVENLERAGKVFVFDGLQAGLFLGRFATWPFDSGFAFATWLWHDGCSPGTGRIVLRILARDDGGGGGGRHQPTEQWLKCCCAERT